MSKQITIRDFDTATAYLASVDKLPEIDTARPGNFIVVRVCHRCGGTGSYSFNRVHGTRCFGCMNTKPTKRVTVSGIEYAREIKKKISAEARAEKKRQAKIEAKRAAVNAKESAWRSANPIDAAILDATDHEIAADIRRKLSERGNVSEKQIALVLKLAREAFAPVFEAPALESGRQEIAGEILSAKWRDNGFGSVLKIVVALDGGQRVWGSLPKAVEDALIDQANGDLAGLVNGKRIAFTATVSVSDDDQAFGFYKRPSKARLA